MQIPDSLTLALGWLAFHFDQLQPFIPTYIHLLLSALFPIYAGSHASLSRPSSAAKPPKKTQKDREADDGDDDDDEQVQKMEGLSTSDALLFPVMAGVTLTSLYFVIKWLEDPALLNKILNWYFAGFSVLSVCRLVSDGLDVFHSILFPRAYVDAGVLYRVDPKRRLALPENGNERLARTSPLPGPFARIPLPRLIKNAFWFLHVVPNQKLIFKAALRSIFNVEFKLGIHGFEGIVIGTATVLYYNFVAKPWYLTNVFGFGFSYGALQLLSPTTFTTGTLLLCLLFFYDIYFVFFTPMMVGVAKSLDVPVKLLFPAPPKPGQDPDTQSLSMLGLGDVVLPGIVIGLALRFDLYLFYFYKQTTKKVAPAEGKQESTEVVKAPYKSVAEGWGERLWSAYVVSHFFAPLAPRLPKGSFTPRGVFPKPYFSAAVTGYVVGMLVTLAAMQVSNHPQPALLYLVPGVLGALWLTALFRGELQLIWTYSDAAEESEETKDTKDGKESKTEGQEKKDVAAEQKKKKKSSGSIIDKLAGRLETQLDSYDRTDDTSESDRTLLSFSVLLPPLLRPRTEDGKTTQKWSDSPAKPAADKIDAGHADKRVRVQ